ncbi:MULTISPECIES: hypothetical protein [unclassified Rothia (in: high G+C Gram-positive bacteria)]|uniref:hypothetical protein n=1 Tax=unclassified Rothia (in: high G+C Gram-positive bacteria) TaxID=2689056 RepID=UPI00195D952F|nr:MULTISPECIES: hypothetical protein [unclassified Rothia (in: high G+C Gram-positive bacteria)]MBM7052120.1 hypothetical protein [Rothia sp. ZJ1223]QRZ61447.1 hypothetical protein JR346_09530 [Rothia sp. ZJ932]
MDLLLIAPVKNYTENHDSQELQNENIWKPRGYESQESYQTRELAQKKKSLYMREGSFEIQDDHDWIFLNYQVFSCDLYSTQDQYFLVVLAEIENLEDFDRMSSLELEEECNRLANFVGDRLDGLNFNWVNRTIIYYNKEDAKLVPNGWISDNGVSIEWSPTLISGGPAADVECLISWGNNKVFSIADFKKEVDPTELIRGIVDAQGIWGKSDELILESQRISHEIIDYKFEKEKDYSKYHNQIMSIKENKALLDLSVDEINLDLQGVRKKTAIACYDAWGLGGLHTRLESRIQSIEGINSFHHENFKSRNRIWVNKLLLALSLLTIFQFFIGVVDISFVGDVKTEAGEGIGELGASKFIRSVSIDLWMIFFAVLTSFIAVFALKKNKDAE